MNRHFDFAHACLGFSTSCKPYIPSFPSVVLSVPPPFDLPRYFCILGISERILETEPTALLRTLIVNISDIVFRVCDCINANIKIISNHRCNGQKRDVYFILCITNSQLQCWLCSSEAFGSQAKARLLHHPCQPYQKQNGVEQQDFS